MVQEYLPEAYILAILLTFVVFSMGVLVAGKSPVDMVNYWGTGYPKLYVFGMQMVMVLLTGYILALTPIAKRCMSRITDIPKTAPQALGITAAVSLISCYFNWGFGLVIGAFLAKEMGRKVKGVHFPLIVAAAYGGELVRGPSSSIPLVAATKGNFMEKLVGIIPVTQTLYSWWNILLSLIIFCALIAVYLKMKPPTEEIIEYKEEVNMSAKLQTASTKENLTFAEKLESAWLINAALGLLPLTYLILNFKKIGFDLDLNLVIFIFLTLGVYLHKNPMTYLGALKEAVVASRGILIQFPLYAGIMGMMGSSGLVDIISNWFVSISTPNTFPLFTFLSAGLINIFIPSGGGQWAIQGPIVMKAAEVLGADKAQTIMAFAWGDAWTNQVQPFWALPLLGVAGLSARDIMGYCVVWTLVSGIIISAMFTAVSFL
jgi:short-chain fatty acids transporter